MALPLSMAIAIASGVTPERGLYTAIVGGFLVSALGGSRFQIGGPAGAFIVLVAATVAAHGVEGLVLATMLSGGLLMLAGALGLGTYIKFIPYPVTVGLHRRDRHDHLREPDRAAPRADARRAWSRGRWWRSSSRSGRRCRRLNPATLALSLGGGRGAGRR